MTKYKKRLKYKQKPLTRPTSNIITHNTAHWESHSNKRVIKSSEIIKSKVKSSLPSKTSSNGKLLPIWCVTQLKQQIEIEHVSSQTPNGRWQWHHGQPQAHYHLKTRHCWGFWMSNVDNDQISHDQLSMGLFDKEAADAITMARTYLGIILPLIQSCYIH